MGPRLAPLVHGNRTWCRIGLETALNSNDKTLSREAISSATTAAADPAVRDIRGRAIRFGITGVANTGIHVVVALVLIYAAGMHESWSNAIAFTVATIFSYIVNSKWSFRHEIAPKFFIRFVTVSLIGVVVSWLVSNIAAEQGAHPLIGILFVTISVAAISFLAHNFWTFSTGRKATSEPGGS